MMKDKQALKKGDTVRYIGRRFDGFDEKTPQAIFLGYDSNDHAGIWIEYQGKPQLVHLQAIEFTAP